jgi:beta-glucosidase-like glycosyl hydrolase
MKELYGRVMLDIEGFYLTDDEKFLISNKYVGGLILFSRNYESRIQLRKISLLQLIKRAAGSNVLLGNSPKYHQCKK